MSTSVPPLPSGFSFADDTQQPQASAVPPLPPGFSDVTAESAATPAPAPPAGGRVPFGGGLPIDINAKGASGEHLSYVTAGGQAPPLAPHAPAAFAPQDEAEADRNQRIAQGISGIDDKGQTAGEHYIGQPFADTAGGARQIYQGAKQDFQAGHGNPLANGGRASSPQSLALQRSGGTRFISGAGTLALAADAPGIMNIVSEAAAGNAAARIALNKMLVYATAGQAAAYDVGKGADKLHLAPETKELLQAGAFFIPGTMGHLAEASGFKAGMGTDPQGNPAFAAQAPGGVTAAGRMGPNGPEVRVKTPGGKVYEYPAQPSTPPPPTPAEISAASTAKAAETSIAQAAALEAAATNVMNGKPPVPPAPPQGPPPPPGMQQGTLTPKVVGDMASIIQALPEEARSGAMQEAHANLTKWIVGHAGKPFTGPDGKLQVADTPQKAASLAQQIINDAVTEHGKAAEQAQKDAEKQQAEQQKQQEQQAKEAEKAATTTNDNGLTPAQVKSERVKTLLEQPIPPGQTPASLIQRNLRVSFQEARQLIDQYHSDKLMSQNAVGSKAEPTVEESRATVDKQIAALQGGQIHVVMLPEGSKYIPAIPAGMKRVDVNGNAPGAGTYIYNPREIRADRIKAAAKAGTHNDLLGHIQTKDELGDGANTVVVQAVAPDGTPLQDSQVHADPALVKTQSEVLAERFGPDATIVVKSPQQVLEERQQAHAAENPPLPAGYTPVAEHEVGQGQHASETTLDANSVEEGGRGKSPEPAGGEGSQGWSSSPSTEKPAETKYDSGSTQANIPEGSEAAETLERMRRAVPDEHLMSFGRDVGENHVTVRYGLLHDDVPESLRRYIEAQAPFDAHLGETDAFPPGPFAKGASAVHAKVESPDLHRLNAEIEQHANFKEKSFPEYKPHATIAYVKPEHAEQYKGSREAAGKKFTVDTIQVSDKNGNTTDIKLKGKPRVAGVDGKETSVLIDGGKLPGRYRIVERSAIVTSHHPQTFAPNGAYPKGVQERNYDTDKEAQGRVIGNAANYEPSYTVNGNTDAINGPPVITPDGIALGGNGRSMSLGRLYDEGRHGEYREELQKQAADFGFTAEQVAEFKEPVLVREVERPGTVEAMRRIGSAMNKPQTGALSPFARAVSAGKNIKPKTLEQIGEMLAKMGGEEPATLRQLMADGGQGRELLRLLVADGAITTAERAGFVDPQSKGLSEEGKTFVERALVGTIIDDPKLMEATPKSVLAKLEASLGGISVIGARDDSWNLLPVIRAAAAEHGLMSRAKMPLEDYLAQSSMFGGRNVLTDAMIRALDGKSSTLRDAFKSFAADSMHDVPNQGMLLVMTEPAAPHDAFNHAFGTKMSADEFYDGLMATAAEDPYEKAKEQEGAFRRQRTRGLSSRQPAEASGSRPSEVPAKPAASSPSADVVPASRGARVSFRDRDGVERTGTVAHANELKTRIKAADGKEYTVNTADVTVTAPPKGNDVGDSRIQIVNKALSAGKPIEFLGKPLKGDWAIIQNGLQPALVDGRKSYNLTEDQFNDLVAQAQKPAPNQFGGPTTREMAEAAAKKEGWKVEKLPPRDGGLRATFRAVAPSGAQLGEFSLPSQAWDAIERKRLEKPVASNPPEEQTLANGDRSPQSESAGSSEPAGGRPSPDLPGGDSAHLEAPRPEEVPGTDGVEAARDTGAGPGPAVREGAAPVSGARPESGSGQGSRSSADNGLAESPAGPLVDAAVKAAAKPPAPRNTAWFNHPADWKAPAGTMGKLDANLEALRTLRSIEKEGRLATPEEQAKLAKFVGWGALSHVFAPTWAPSDQRARYIAAAKELDGLLNREEMAAAARSTQNAHYTSPELVRAMWDIAKRLGFKGGIVLEPSMGSGNFFGMMPEAIRGAVNAYGNELDPLTAAIAKQLYPGATISNEDFIKLVIPDNSIDLAISNVPFGEAVYDPKTKLKAPIHDYFFAKSLDKVRPGGVVAFITSTGTMDKANGKIRDLLASKADLLGAIRLPSGAFGANAGTAVTTDLVLLQKRAPGQEPQGPAWAGVVETKLPTREGKLETAHYNEYFAEHPEMMLGEPGLNEMNGRQGGFALYPRKGDDFAKLLEAAIGKLPKGAMLTSSGAKPVAIDTASTAREFAQGHHKEGQYVLDDKGNLRQVAGGELVKPKVLENADGTVSPAKLARMKEMVGLRDDLNKLMASMLEQPDSEEGNSVVAQQRDKLRRGYDRFQKKYGYLNASPNRIFDEDPHYPRLMALEQYDTAKKIGSPADILTKRTIFPKAPLTALSADPKDALYQVLAERGKPDVPFMARLQGKTEEEVGKTLVDAGLAYRDPETGDYETKEKYLSGYVRDKLDAARAAVKQGRKEYQPNVTELEKVQPEDIPIKEIEVKLGATWIPIPAIEDFIKDVLKVQGTVKNAAGTWSAKSRMYSPETNATYGTGRIHAIELLTESLNQREVTIRDKDADGNYILNKMETILARQKQKDLRDAFNKWASESLKWAAPLEKAYNYAFNNLVLPEYDGSHLTFPGMTKVLHGQPFELKPHQKDAVWRIIQDGRALLAHVVGAGKTLEVIASTMEGRRTGTFRKPMVVVPNHLVGQWASEWLAAYPGANLLVPTPRDFEAKNRQRLMSKIATGDYDAVILAHSQFNLMDISPERQLRTIGALQDELVATIEALQAEKGGDNKRTVKQMQKALERLKTRMDELQDLKADKAINFDELGVDHLAVDEAHAYKNLAFYTKMQRVSGLAQGDAKRALRLKSKTEYLQEMNNGRGVVFATGTPLQNTMAEQYNMTKFVAPDVLERAGIKFFDDWAANFGQVQTKNEVTPAGGIKAKSRFNKFSNVPELMNMFRSFTDIKTAKMLNLPTPKLTGGAPQSVVLNPSVDQLEYMEQLLRRAENMPSDPRIDNMLKVVSDGKKAALDMRLVNPDARDHDDSKINSVVRDVLKEWERGKAQKTTQLVFLDQYRRLEDGKETLNLYHDMRKKWIAEGVPPDQIAIIGDYDTDAKKVKLFSQVNAGDVRILMGSTEKMGAGMNVQRLLKALHHVDLPWRPGDLAQRNGRIERRGNLNDEVTIKHWNTAKSFDTYMLQALESKAGFIEQLMSGRYTGRTMEDLDSSVSMNLQAMKVATSGNPDIQLRFDLEQEREQLLTLKRAHDIQKRDSVYTAGRIRNNVSRKEALLPVVKKYADKYKAALGADGESYSLEVDGKKFTDRKEGEAYLTDMRPPWGGFRMTMQGVEVEAELSAVGTDTALRYHFPWQDMLDAHTAPQATMDSLGRSIEARLRQLPKMEDHLRADIESDTEDAAKYDKLAQGEFAQQGKLDEVTQQLAEVDARLGLGANHGASDEIVADEPEDDEPEADDDEGEGGVTFRSSLAGVDVLAELGYKALTKLYHDDIAPQLAKVAPTAKGIAKEILNVVAPRVGADKDALDAMMKLKGELEATETHLEYAFKGIKKLADSMTEDERLAFIDAQKTGGKQATPELQKIADIYREADTAGHHEAVEVQIGNMEAKQQRLWKNLDPAQRAEYWRKVETNQPIAQPGDEEKAKTGNPDAALRLELQGIADNTLKFKQNHFRVFWKTIPSGEDQLPTGVTKKPFTPGARRPLQGDKGFLKQATLASISEGIARGGVPVTTNFQKLFELGQMSLKRYTTAQKMWQRYRELGLRKYVRTGTAEPEGWQEVPDNIARTYFHTPVGFVETGKWYVEPSAARLLTNYLSRDLFKDTAIGRGLLAYKNFATAFELGLSPFHAVNMAFRAAASEMGLGVMQAWNSGVRGGNLQDFLKGAGLAGTSLAGPVRLALAGRRTTKAIEDIKKLMATPGGKKFVDALGGDQQVLGFISDYFTGGGTLHMPREYRVDMAQSFREAWTSGNHLGALIRGPFAAASVAMKPLFEHYIPWLKLGLFMKQFPEMLDQEHAKLANGDITRAELARKVVDTIENRFGEMNFSNLFWNNTYKSAMQFVFRSVTWKLGEWRAAGTALAPEMAEAFEDPLKAFREGRAGKDGDSIPKMGQNQAYLLGAGLMAVILGTVAGKLMSGKFPWEWLEADKERGHSAGGALLLESMFPRLGSQNKYTGLPERLDMPSGFRDYIHAERDPGQYLKSSLAGPLSHAWESMENRDYFGNYVYDPKGSAFQKMGELFSYNAPRPFMLDNLLAGRAGDKTKERLGLLGLNRATSDLDLTPAEKRMREIKESKHTPLTPEQMQNYRQRDAGEVQLTHRELKRAIHEKKLDYAQKLFEGLTYAEARDIYDNYASPAEQRVLHPMLTAKRTRMLKQRGK